jgi:alpha-1,2-glucosyltransferase
MAFVWACGALVAFATAFAVSFFLLGEVIVQQHGAFSGMLHPHIRNLSSVTDGPQMEVSSCPTNDQASLDLTLRGKQKRAFLYMDELFHFEQMLRYVIDSNFSYYDPMITTPPGSYLLTSLWLHVALGNEADRSLVSQGKRCSICSSDVTMYCATCGLLERLELFCVELSQSSAFCETIGLRAPRTYAESLYSARMFGCLQHFVTGALLSILVASKSLPGGEVGALASGLLCFLLPPVMFTTMLVYTDITSLMIVAALVILTPSGMTRPTLRTRVELVAVAALGAFGILCRQTNVVWLMFVAGRYCLERLFAECFRDKASAGKVFWRVLEALTALLPILLVGLLFAYFVVFVNNMAIVLGDTSNHQPAFHLAQIAYFFVSVPLFFPIQSLSTMWRWFFNFRAATALGVLTCLLSLALQHFAIFHRYLVSDNRHFTFYLWRRVLQNDLLRVSLLAPIATAGAATFVELIFHSATCQTVRERLGSKGGNDSVPSMIRTWHWVSLGEMLLLLCCTMIACVPQALLEFRYFVPSLAVMQLLRATRRQYEPRVDSRAKVADVFYLLAIHCVTSVIFTYCPFTAPDGTVGRFMW